MHASQQALPQPSSCLALCWLLQFALLWLLIGAAAFHRSCTNLAEIIDVHHGSECCVLKMKTRQSWLLHWLHCDGPKLTIHARRKRMGHTEKLKTRKVVLAALCTDEDGELRLQLSSLVACCSGRPDRGPRRPQLWREEEKEEEEACCRSGATL